MPARHTLQGQSSGVWNQLISLQFGDESLMLAYSLVDLDKSPRQTRILLDSEFGTNRAP